MPFRPHDDGVVLSVRLTPKASKNILVGIRDAADGSRILAIKVTTVPEKGKANATLTKLIAKSLRMPSGKVALLSGHSSRNKEVLVSGETDAIMSQINKLLEDTTHG